MDGHAIYIDRHEKIMFFQQILQFSPTDRQTDRPSYRDAIAASKNDPESMNFQGTPSLGFCFPCISNCVCVFLPYQCNALRTNGRTDRLTDGRINGWTKG